MKQFQQFMKEAARFYTRWGWYDPQEQEMYEGTDTNYEHHDQFIRRLGYKNGADAIDECGLIRWAITTYGTFAISFANFRDTRMAAVQMIKDMAMDLDIEMDVSSDRRPHEVLLSKSFPNGQTAIAAINTLPKPFLDTLENAAK